MCPACPLCLCSGGCRGPDRQPEGGAEEPAAQGPHRVVATLRGRRTGGHNLKSLPRERATSQVGKAKGKARLAESWPSPDEAESIEVPGVTVGTSCVLHMGRDQPSMMTTWLG